MSGAEDGGGDAALDGRGEIEEAERVADVGAGAADAGGELLVGGAEVVQELPVGGRLLQRVQLLAVEVLHEGVTEQVVVRGLPDDGGDRVQAGPLGRAPAPLPHDQLVAGGRQGRLTHHDRLEQADDRDRGGQLLQRLLVEVGAGLARVGGDLLDGQLREAGAVHHVEVGLTDRSRGVLRRDRRDGCRRDQRTEAPAQAPRLT